MRNICIVRKYIYILFRMNIIIKYILLMIERGKFVHGKYINKRKLGRGKFTDVFLVQEQGKQGEEYAIKRINKKILNQNEKFQEYLKEAISVMENINSENIVGLKEFIEDDDYYYMVLQYCNGKDLLDLQAKQPNKVLTLEQTVQILNQVILGLEILHKQGSYHGRIRHEHMLIKNINEQKKCKLLYFNAFKFYYYDQDQFLGWHLTLAPQELNPTLYQEDDRQYNHPCGRAIDVWEFGVLMFRMLNLDYPFRINPFFTIEKKHNQLSNQAQNFSYYIAVAKTKKKLLQNCTYEMEDLFSKIFCVDHEKRITLSQIKMHPIFLSHVKQDYPRQLDDRFPQRISKIKSKLPILEDYKNILKLKIEQIFFLLKAVDEIKLVEEIVGEAQSLMFSFNLIKYHIVLLRKNLSPIALIKKYPALQWKTFVSSPQFAVDKRQCLRMLVEAQKRYDQLYTKCRVRLNQISDLNNSFTKAISTNISQEELKGEFFQSYRKSTNNIYIALIKHLKCNQIEKKICIALCVTCICHVFSDLYNSDELKKQTFSIILTDNYQSQGIISYRSVVSNLAKSQKETILMLAKNIITNIMK